MVDYERPRPPGGGGPRVAAAPPRLDGDVQAVIEELCQHVQDRFPERIEPPAVRALIETVVNRWQATLRDSSVNPVKGLLADADRAALAWLKNHGVIPAGAEYDDLLARTVFDGQFDAAAIRAGMSSLVEQRRRRDLLVVTQYLDMIELDGCPPSPRAVVQQLKHHGRGLTEAAVRDILLDFYALLLNRTARQP